MGYKVHHLMYTGYGDSRLAYSEHLVLPDPYTLLRGLYITCHSIASSMKFMYMVLEDFVYT